MYVKVKELPSSIQHALHGLGCRRADVRVEVSDHVDAPSAFGKGHRGQIVMLEISTGRSMYSAGAWGGSNPFSQRPVDTGGSSPLPPGYAAVTSTMTGLCTLHLNPANVEALLPSAGGEVTAREAWILGTYAGLTSAGRKYEYERRHRGQRPGDDEIAELARRGLLKINKAGAVGITTEGRNLAGSAGRRPEFAPRETPAPERREHGLTAEDLLLPVGVKPVK